MKSFGQTGEEEVSRKDTGAIVNLLGPIVRFSYDQFSYIAVCFIKESWDLVKDALVWPSQDISRVYNFPSTSLFDRLPIFPNFTIIPINNKLFPASTITLRGHFRLWSRYHK